MSTFDLLGHAKAAVDRTERSLNSLRHDLEAQAATMGRQYRLLASEAVHDLARRHSLLVDLQRRLAQVPQEQAPVVWRRFLTRYDDYLEAVREVKCRLAREEYWESTAANTGETRRRWAH